MDKMALTRRQRAFRSMVAVLASGSMFQTCETRLRDAFVMGTKDYVLSLFDPQNVLDLIEDPTIDAP